jgi:hypothetical protein
MSHRSNLVVRILLVLVLGGILAPAAYAKGGVTVRTYAPPPLDAGSALPNPDYASQAVRPDDRASRALVHAGAQQSTAVSASTKDGFDWGDAGIGAAGTVVFVLIGIAPVLVFRQSRRLART